MTSLRNERIKLLANAFDRASTACFTLGAIGPIAAVVYAGTGAVRLGAGFFVAAAASWLLAAIALHIVAREILGGLRDDVA
jgi:hypothetical protein